MGRTGPFASVLTKRSSLCDTVSLGLETAIDGYSLCVSARGQVAMWNVYWRGGYLFAPTSSQKHAQALAWALLRPKNHSVHKYKVKGHNLLPLWTQIVRLGYIIELDIYGNVV